MAMAWEHRGRAFAMVLGVAPDTEACYNCVHFQPHYTQDGALIHRGSCLYPRLKIRRLDDACEYFEMKEETK